MKSEPKIYPSLFSFHFFLFSISTTDKYSHFSFNNFELPFFHYHSLLFNFHYLTSTLPKNWLHKSLIQISFLILEKYMPFVQIGISTLLSVSDIRIYLSGTFWCLLSTHCSFVINAWIMRGYFLIPRNHRQFS